MKRLLVLLPLILTACDPARHSAAQDMFQGSHDLRKMTTTNGIKGNATFSGFFLFGNGSAQVSSDLFVTFSWHGNDNIWMVSTLPVSKFRFQFDDSAKTPTVRFKWRPCNYDCDDKKDELIEYVVLTCRSGDWPRDVQLPLNKPVHSYEDDDGGNR